MSVTRDGKSVVIPLDYLSRPAVECKSTPKPCSPPRPVCRPITTPYIAPRGPPGPSGPQGPPGGCCDLNERFWDLHPSLFRAKLNETFPVKIGPAAQQPLITCHELAEALNCYIEQPAGGGGNLDLAAFITLLNTAFPTRIGANGLITCSDFDAAVGSCVTASTFRRKIDTVYPTKIGPTGLLTNAEFANGFVNAVDCTAFRSKVDSCYPERIGAEGMITCEDFNEAIRTCLTCDTITELAAQMADCLPGASGATGPSGDFVTIQNFETVFRSQITREDLLQILGVTGATGGSGGTLLSIDVLLADLLRLSLGLGTSVGATGSGGLLDLNVLLGQLLNLGVGATGSGGSLLGLNGILSNLLSLTVGGTGPQGSNLLALSLLNNLLNLSVGGTGAQGSGLLVLLLSNLLGGGTTGAQNNLLSLLLGSDSTGAQNNLLSLLLNSGGTGSQGNLLSLLLESGSTGATGNQSNLLSLLLNSGDSNLLSVLLGGGSTGSTGPLIDINLLSSLGNLLSIGVGQNGILTPDQFRAAFNSYVTSNDVQSKLGGSIGGNSSSSATYSFTYAGAPDQKYLSSVDAPAGTFSDDVPAVITENSRLKTLSFANSNNGASCTFYLLKNWPLDSNTAPTTASAYIAYRWMFNNKRSNVLTLPEDVTFAAGDTLTVWCSDSFGSSANVSVRAGFVSI